jgi:hypothetical protein
MDTTITLDDETLREAREYFPDLNDEELVRQAIHEKVQREAVRRVVALGGTMPDFRVPGRPVDGR